MKKTELEENWKEGYEEGWDNGFKACLHYLQDTLADQIIIRKRTEEKNDEIRIVRR